MSKRIVVLSSEVVGKIAAGEVVERPASIVKELVENSIDAGATNIDVELGKGGCQSIKVADDGLGMDAEDVPLVFKRHATSKIHKFEDIYHIYSFGFRGEAIPSIASVARVELLTRGEGEKEGTKAVAEAGTVKEISPAGCPVGTKILVSDIFARVPARKKFLKKETTEQSLCMEAIIRLALAHPEIRFHVLSNGRESFTAPKTNNIAQRVAAVMGMDFSAHCIPVNDEKESMKLTGFVSHPEFNRSNSKYIYLYVNKRFVRDNSMLHAVLSAYRQVIPPRRYPAGVLFIELPAQDVDVNVHPAKLEVRFRDSRGVYDLIFQTVGQNLLQASAKDSFVYRLEQKKNESSIGDARQWYKYHDKSAALISQGVLPSRALKEAVVTAGLEYKPVGERVGEHASERITFSGWSYLGQIAGTYLVFSGEDGLLLIDQHAAHERIILERLKNTGQQKVASQRLLMPEIVSVTQSQITLLSEHIALLYEAGLEVEIFGKDTLAIKTLPAILSGSQAKEVIVDIADKLTGKNQLSSLQEKKEEIFVALACRAAVKANNMLSLDEIAALCRDLEKTPFSSTCPHGRPISIKFPISEIEKMFKRK
ncbi:MAG TPA: DNA mismatch repair endonuclease MutL [Smithellaceae bacterium]|nr:DNA mismatch repair endonuclease MutL [Smithellaceae bacterium]